MGQGPGYSMFSDSNKQAAASSGALRASRIAVGPNVYRILLPCLSQGILWLSLATCSSTTVKYMSLRYIILLLCLSMSTSSKVKAALRLKLEIPGLPREYWREIHLNTPTRIELVATPGTCPPDTMPENATTPWLPDEMPEPRKRKRDNDDGDRQRDSTAAGSGGSSARSSVPVPAVPPENISGSSLTQTRRTSTPGVVRHRFQEGGGAIAAARCPRESRGG